MPPRKHALAKEPPDFITVEECADFLHASRRTVDSRIADGSIVAYRVPGSRRLLIDNEVIADIRARRVVPEAS